MDINGKWRIDAVMSFETQPDGSNWRKIDPNTDDEDMLECLNMFFVFDENEMRTLIRISPDVSDEEIEQAKKEGALITDDRCMYQVQELKRENGKVYYNSGITGEILGEEADPWLELTVDEDGSIILMTFKLRRID